MTTRSTPTTNTPTTSSGKICLTKRHDSHSQSRSSSSPMRLRREPEQRQRAASTPKNLPVKPTVSPDALASTCSAATSSVAAVSASAAPVQRLQPSWMRSKPRHEVNPTAHQQQDQQRALDRDAFLAPARRRRAPAGRAAPENPRRRPAAGASRPGTGKEPELQRAGQQQRHPEQHENQRRAAQSALGLRGEQGVGGGVVRGVVGVEQQRHDQSDADAERKRQQQPRHGKVGADDVAGVDQRENVGRRREEQERDCGADARALAVDAGEQRHDRARTHGQHRPGQRGGRIRNEPRRAAAEKARDVCFGISAVIAPAMKNAGSRHSSTCAAR